LFKSSDKLAKNDFYKALENSFETNLSEISKTIKADLPINTEIIYFTNLYSSALKDIVCQ